MEPALQWILGALALTAQIAGLAGVWRVLHSDRSSEGTVAWIFGLVFLPLVVAPFFWLFGARHYTGYRTAIRRALASHHEQVETFWSTLESFAVAGEGSGFRLARFSPFPATGGNGVRLLRDGEEKFEALFTACRAARACILVEYFSIAGDATGRAFLDCLIERARSGVAVYVLFDRIGSRTLPGGWLREARAAGVRIQAFRSTLWWSSRFQLNFRNHRKLLVVDGRVGFVGGFNVGDQYRGRHRRLRPWRDTHLRLEGPAALKLQAIVAADWYWSTREFLEDLPWGLEGSGTGGQTVAIVPTGPSDERGRATLLWLDLIARAQQRLWIASPYLVPSESILEALELAVVRGVEVRILTTAMRDHRTVFLAGFFFAEQLRRRGVRVFRWQPGFCHQKVILVDRKVAMVGTVNMDSRSLHLNFEVSALLSEVDAVEAMLRADFEQARPTVGEWDQLGLGTRAGASLARLFAPLL